MQSLIKLISLCLAGFSKSSPRYSKTLKITPNDYLMGRSKEYPLSDRQRENMYRLLGSVNTLLNNYGQKVPVTSGYRPGRYNAAAGGAERSTHLTCEGIDLADARKELAQWILDNRWILMQTGLYMEDPAYTPTHVHLQTRPTRNRIFIP